MAFSHIGPTDLHYIQVGKGPDLIMIHGLGGNLAVWFLHINAELRNDFKITMYDLRGHGKSGKPPTGYTTKDMADDLKNLLDVLGIQRVCIIGHSWGGDIAMHFSILYPDRVDKIIVIEPNIAALIDLRNNKDWKGWQYWVTKLAEFGINIPTEKQQDPDYLLRQTVHLPILFGPLRGRARPKNMVLDLLDKTTLIDDYKEVAGLTLERINAISRPILAIYTKMSHFKESYEYLHNNVNAIDTIMLPEGDHYSPLHQPEIIVEHVKSFLGLNKCAN